MLTAEVSLAFLLGIGVGLVIAIIVQQAGIRAAGKELRKMEKDKDRNDPANWWKYGGDPFGNSVYDRDD